MRHQKKNLKFAGRDRDHRHALLRNLATSVILYEKIKTTKRKARAVTPLVHKLIALSKKQNHVNAIREINRIVFDKNASKKLIEELSKRFEKTGSGYTRIIPLGPRKGDSAPIVQLQLVEGIKRAPDNKPENKTSESKETKTAAKAKNSKKQGKKLLAAK